MALTGVGGLCATATTARLLAELRPRRVLFVGTCGAYGGSLHVGDCISAAKAIATSAAELQRRAFRPRVEVTRWPATWALPLPEHAVASPPAITSYFGDATLFGSIASAEQLELAGVFAACHLAETPVAAALAVANRTGPGAHAEWVANYEEVSRKLGETLLAASVFD